MALNVVDRVSLFRIVDDYVTDKIHYTLAYGTYLKYENIRLRTPSTVFRMFPDRLHCGGCITMMVLI